MNDERGVITLRYIHVTIQNFSWQRSQFTHPPFKAPVRELYQFVVLSNLLGNMEQNTDVEKAETLKEEGNEFFKSNYSFSYGLS